MIIYTKNGDLAFKEFSFPDGQPHFQLQTKDEAKEVTIETRMKNPDELFKVLLAHDVLRRFYEVVNLDIRYLMAARMDRSIDKYQPWTLSVVAHAVWKMFDKIRILDPHSRQSLFSFPAEAVLPFHIVDQVIQMVGRDVTIVTPDKGAIERTALLTKGATGSRVQALKHRDMQTGQITGMTLENPKDVGEKCLIVDDICDGGATFTSLATLLKDAGAKEIYLYVTHGIFSKKLPLPNITRIFTTDSYYNWSLVPHCSLICTPISMRQIP